MKKAIIAKMEKAADLLEEIQASLEEEMEAIDDKANDRESGEKTEKEEEAYDKMDEAKESIENYIDELRSFTEE